MTYDDLIQSAESALRSAIAERDARQSTLMKMRSDVAAGTEIPAEEIPTAIAARDEASAAVQRAEDALATLRAEKAEDDHIAELRTQIVDEQPRRSYDQVARVGREERTYRPDADPDGTEFLRDFVSGAVFGDFGAQQRLGRHMDEERTERGEIRANVPSANFGSLVVPAYLTDLYAPKARANRPLADAMRKHPLPATGNTIEIAKITTGTTTAVRSDETSAVSETNIDDTSFSVNVLEVAGAQSLSRKSVMRGTGIDSVVLEDLFSAYNTTVDSTIINQATTGLDAVATQVAYTDSSPTAAELYPKLLAAGAAVEAALLDQDPNGTAFIMHSRRWAWIQSQLSSTFPLIAQPVNAGLNVAGVANNSGYGSGPRGYLPNGAPVFVDNNIATNVDVGGATTHDKIFVVSLPECHLWEDPSAPMMIRTDTGPSMKSNAVDIVIFGFMAYTFLRQAHVQAIYGTGTVAPTF
ncbi:MAG: hypothetical protein IPN92_21050 [Chromatiaceae bacterium]|nr:hypothetical protein [Chromatiaceae bacterium]